MDTTMATKFEYRHRMLLRALIIGAAFLTYLFDRDDIVWRFVKGSPAHRELERALFFVATLFVGAGAGICTWACAGFAREAEADTESQAGEGSYRYLSYSQHAGDLLFAIGLGSLAPLSGFIILVAGEAIRVFRLIGRPDAFSHAQKLTPEETSVPWLRQSDRFDSRSTAAIPQWSRAFGQEAAKWGLFLTMVVFTITLRDRLAEVLAGASVLVSTVLALRHLSHWPSYRE